MGRQLSTTRPFPRTYSTHHQHVNIGPGFATRPCDGWAPVMPLPVGLSDIPFNGMDPSDPATYVRAWNPRPGMISRLNYDGAQHQGHTPMGGTWGLHARARAVAAGRPSRRPRLWPSAGDGSGTASPTLAATRPRPRTSIRGYRVTCR